MKAEIKSFDCIDHDPIEKWIPENENDIDIYIAFHIGPKLEKGADLFYAHIVTNNNIPEEQNSKHIEITKYDFETIKNRINTIITSIESENWSEYGKELNKYLDWEFDNYQKF